MQQQALDMIFMTDVNFGKEQSYQMVTIEFKRNFIMQGIATSYQRHG